MLDEQLRRKVRLTGLTGGIASGKSRAVSFLTGRFGLVSYSADTIAHNLLEPGREGWRFVRGINPDFINPDNTINKPLFRSELFKDKKLREKVNAGIHPLVWKALVRKIGSLPGSPGMIPVLAEVPLLYEAGWGSRFDEVIVIYAGRENCRNRLAGRDTVSGFQAERELSAQMPLWEKCMLADHVVNNSGAWSLAVLELLHLGEILWPGKRG